MFDCIVIVFRSMGKINMNPYRNSLSAVGIVNMLDAMIDQPLLKTSDVQFNDMLLTGDLTVDGNTLLRGQISVIETDVLKITDNLVELNVDNVNPLMLGGLQINRGMGLTPYQMLYDEQSGNFRAGYLGTLRAVATREDSPVNNGVAVYDAATSSFLSKTSVSLPFKFLDDLFIPNKSLVLGPSGSPPTISGDSGGSMRLSVSSGNIHLGGDAFAGDLMVSPLARLNFNGSTISSSSGNILDVHTSTIALSKPGCAFQWFNGAGMSSPDGRSLLQSGAEIYLNASSSVRLNAFVPLTFGDNVTLRSESNNVFKVKTSGSVIFDIGGSLDAPVVTFGRGGNQASSNVRGDLVFDSIGHLILDPAENVVLNGNTSLWFGTSNRALTVTDTNIVLSNTVGALILDPGTFVALPGRVRLRLGEYSSVGESVSHALTLENTFGEILLETASAVKIPSGTFLCLSDSEKLSSNGTDLLLDAYGSIVSHANFVLPLNRQLNFGDTSNKVYLSGTGSIMFEAANDVVFRTGGSVIFDELSFSSGLLFRQTSVGGLTVSLPNIAAMLSLPRTTCDSLTVTGDLTLQDGVRVLNDAEIMNDMLVHGKMTVIGSADVSSVRMSEKLSVTAGWDGAQGYAVSRGASTLKGGRLLYLSVPSYTRYGSLGAKPAVGFGTEDNELFFSADEAETRVYKGTLTVDDSTSGALKVSGGAIVGGLVTENLAVSGALRGDATGIFIKKLVVDDAMEATAQGVSFSAAVNFNSLGVFSSGLSATSPVSFNAGLNMGGTVISNLAMPFESHHACPKAYVDLIKKNLPVKGRVRAASTENKSLLLPILELDGVGVLENDRILLKDQTDLRENGIYVLNVDRIPASRSTDMEEGSDGMGALTYVEGGFENGKTTFMASAPSATAVAIQVGSEVMVWTPFSGASSIQSGAGLYAHGNVLEVVVDQKTIEIGNNGLTFAPPAVGLEISGVTGKLQTTADQSHVIKIGRVSSGEWSATTISGMYGGTGLTGVSRGSVLYGGDAFERLSVSPVFTYLPLSGFPNVYGLGLGTAAPASNLHVVAQGGPTVTIEGTGPGSFSQMRYKTDLNEAKISLTTDGTFYLGQESENAGSRIVLATQHQPRLIIDNLGAVRIFNSLMVQGKVTAGSCAVGAVTVSQNVVSVPPNTDLNIVAANVNFSGSIAAPAGTIASLAITSASSLDIQASFAGQLRFNGLAGPVLSLDQNSVHAPSMILGGASASQGIAVRTKAADVVYIESQNVAFDMASVKVKLGTVVFRDPIVGRENMLISNDGDAVSFSNPNAGRSLLTFGAGGGPVVTRLTNPTGSAYVEFSPGASTTAMLEVSANTESRFLGNATFSGTVGIGKGAFGTLNTAGWHYLGQLRQGRTTLSVPNAFSVTFDFDGLWPYTTSAVINDRNQMEIVVYYDGIKHHLFAVTSSDTVRLNVEDAPQPLSFTKYEGAGVVPNGSSSNFVSATWTLGWKLSTAVASLPLSVGTFQASGLAKLNGVSVTGSLSLVGALECHGTTSFVGDSFSYASPLGQNVTLSPSTLGGVLLDVNARAGGSAQVRLGDGVSTAGSISADAASGLQLNAENTFSITVGTNHAPQITVKSGEATLQSSLNVTGQARFRDSVVIDSALTVPHLIVGTVDIGMTNDGSLSLNGRRMTNVSSPVYNNDVATKGYCDTVARGVARTVTVASTGPVLLTDPVTVIDGTLVYPDYTVLLKNQSDPVQNGVYVVELGFYLSRSDILSENDVCSGITLWVSHGDVNGSCAYMCDNMPGQDVVGTDDLHFVQVSNTNEISAGSGLRKSGNQLSVQTDNVSLEVFSNGLRLASAGIGQGLSGGSGSQLRVSDISHLDTLGRIRTGFWEAAGIAMQYGGTGNSSFPAGAVVYSNGERLKSGPLHFDEINGRLGIGTTTPTSGLTVVDRDAQLMSTGSGPSALIFTSVTTGTAFALRNESSKFILSAGVGADKSALFDVVSVATDGNVSLTSSISAPRMNLGSTLYSPNYVARLEAGPNIQSLYSLDNSGCVTCWYGGTGNHLSNVNSEFARCGYYNGRFVLQTSSSGSGQTRSLCLQSGGNTNQVVLKPDGSVDIAGGVTVSGNMSIKDLDGANLRFQTIKATGSVEAKDLILGTTLFSTKTDGSMDVSPSVNSSTSVLLGLRGSASGPASLRVYGLDVSGSAEWMSVGFVGTSFRFATNSTGTGIPRSMVFSTQGVPQMTLNTDLTVSLASDVTVQGKLETVFLQTARDALIKGNLQCNAVIGTTSLVVSDSIMFNKAGSLDTLSMKYQPNDASLNVYGSNAARMVICTGGTHPDSLDRSSLELGYLDPVTHVIRSSSSGTGVLRHLALQCGTSGPQVRVSATDVTIVSRLTVQNAETTAVSVVGGVQIGGTLSLAGSLKMGGTELSSGGLTVSSGTWSYKAADGAAGWTVDTVAKSISSTFQNKVYTDSASAFVVSGTVGDVLRVDTLQGLVDMNGFRIVNGGAPVADTDLCTKGYLDSQRFGVGFKMAALVASPPGQSFDLTRPVNVVDGVAVVPGDRILLKSQDANPVENGIYVVSAGNLVNRSEDLAFGSHASASFCYVENGATHAQSQWVCAAVRPFDVVGTHALQFTQFGGNNFEVGRGLTRTEDDKIELFLDSNSGLFFNGLKLRVDPRIAGKNLHFAEGQIHLMDTVSNVTWQGVTVAVPFGGTGQTTFTDGAVVFADGSDKLSSATGIFYHKTKMIMGIGTRLPDPASRNDVLTVKGDTSLQGALQLTDTDGTCRWRLSMNATDGSVIMSVGQSLTPTALTDALLLTQAGKVCIGYSRSETRTSTASVDIKGTLHCGGAVSFDVPLAVVSGGTGVATLPKGVVLCDNTSAFTSSGALGDGAVVIGTPSGGVAVESGAVLRRHIGLEIGVNVSAWSSTLDNLAQLSFAAGNFIVGVGNSFQTASGAAARTALGLGALAVMNTVDNDVWLGKALSVYNGGTGSRTYTDRCIPYFNGTVYGSTTLFYDDVGDGFGIGVNRVFAGCGLLTYGKDICLQSTAAVPSPGLLFQNQDGTFAWRLRSGAGQILTLSGGPQGGGAQSSLQDFVTFSPGTGRVRFLSVDPVSGPRATRTAAVTVIGGTALLGDVIMGDGTASAVTIEGSGLVSGQLRVQGLTELDSDVNWARDKTVQTFADSDTVTTETKLLETGRNSVSLLHETRIFVPGADLPAGQTEQKPKIILEETGNCILTSTDNNPEEFSGGALTVRGGSCISGDAVVGGNLMVSGDIFTFGDASSPVIGLQDCSNVAAASMKRSRLKKEPGGERLLTVSFSATPLVTGQWSYFTFPLPDRISSFSHPMDATSMATSFSEKPSPASLSDVICSVVQGTNLGRIMFKCGQFVTQYIQADMRYTV